MRGIWLFLPGFYHRNQLIMKRRKGRTCLLLILVLQILVQFPLMGQGKKKLSREDYIKTYSDLAMKEMARVGIPASITLAQGILESNNGNSTLATKGNNHFGIKCHDWTGKKIYHDDDAKHECFRSYDSPYESYMDHSQFLSTRSRYAGLFELKPRDYRGWAKGLKRAGYATAPKYADLLIKIIEENELYRFDVLVLDGGVAALNEDDSTGSKPNHGYSTSREVGLNNKVEFILVQPGDTPEIIRKEMDLYANELYRYNNLYKGEELKPGQVIYLQPKRRKAAKGNDMHVLKAGETMYDISQIYAVKLENLYRMNLMNEGAQPTEGTEINLRRKKRGKGLKLEAPEEATEEDEMQFILEG